MINHPWVDEFPAAVTICDTEGIILEMNGHAAAVFEKDGGVALLGSNLLDCHPEPSRTTLARLLREGTGNVYTIEKNGVKKLIYQSPWYREGIFAGIVEISMEIPATMPHFIRG